MIDVKFDVGQLINAKDKARLFQLPENRKRQLNKRLGAFLVKQTRRRIREQKDVRGGGIKKRKDGKRRALAKMGKGLVVYPSAKGAIVTWGNGLMGSIAYQHHHGLSERWTGAKLKRLFGEPDYEKPATREQARSLLALGFKVKQNGTRKRPTQKWIMEKLSVGDAGFLIRKFQGSQPKKSWLVSLPKRQVLGATPADVLNMVDMIKQFIQK